MNGPAADYTIDIADEQDCLPLDEEFLRDVVRRTLEAERVRAAEISLALVDNAAIHDVNRQYLDHDCPTDVISFLLESEVDATSPAESGEAVPRGTGKRIDGEIVVSAQMACEMAEQYSWTPLNELVLYIVHGMLHLCGYDDLSDDERVVMRAREREILRIWNLTPHVDASEGDVRSPADGPTGAGA